MLLKGVPKICNYCIANSTLLIICSLQSMESSIQYVRKTCRTTNISYPPDTKTYVCLSGDQQRKFFEKFCVLAK